MGLIKLQNQDYQVKGNDQGPLPLYFFNVMPVLALGKLSKRFRQFSPTSFVIEMNRNPSNGHASFAFL